MVVSKPFILLREIVPIKIGEDGMGYKKRGRKFRPEVPTQNGFENGLK
jgi:hypothetical protein